MDRVTPEQDGSVTQTKQEKWMQMAKEAWNNKEKIEPFHFLPEVCGHISRAFVRQVIAKALSSFSLSMP
jgi:hypothetical protein